MTPDKFSKEKRSEIMSKIRSKDTKIEIKVFAELRKRKIYFQKHYGKIFGNPDIALPRKKKQFLLMEIFGMALTMKNLKKGCRRVIGLGKLKIILNVIFLFQNRWRSVDGKY